MKTYKIEKTWLAVTGRDDEGTTMYRPIVRLKGGDEYYYYKNFPANDLELGYNFIMALVVQGEIDLRDWYYMGPAAYDADEDEEIENDGY